ncbi:MAG: hypothetical protein H0W12_07060 [Chitinophagaceae bacterium]|nr:hypothetical protein [Chitinophagaceae bacterium]
MVINFVLTDLCRIAATIFRMPKTNSDNMATKKDQSGHGIFGPTLQNKKKARAGRDVFHLI